MTECLSRILFPFDTSWFLEHYQARKHFHVQRESPGFYRDFLTPGDLDLALKSEQLPAAFVGVVKEGARYLPEEWSRVAESNGTSQRVAIPEKLSGLHSEGATLILNQADRAVPSLKIACRELTSEFGFPIQANVYVTPRGSSGFSKHADDHEVLVMQIAGTKRWLLYPSNVPPDSPPVEIDMQPGDLLYLPRGLAHAARSQDQNSIHVTLGLRPAYTYQLIDELAAIAAEDPDFQQPAPPRFADDRARGEFGAAFLRDLTGLMSKTTPAELMERRLNFHVGNQAQGWQARLSDLLLIRDMTLETIVRRRAGVSAVIKGDGKFLGVEFADRRVLVPGFLKCALDLILGGDTFAVLEIEGMIDDRGKVRLASEFVKAGLLRIVSI
jgi:hypothetical protein